MKTPAEVIAEGIIISIENKDPREKRGPLNYLKRKCIQINFPNLREVIVIHFNGNADNTAGIHYEIYSTPIIHCRKCGWNGTIADLPVYEKKVEVKAMSEIFWEPHELMNPVLRKIVEICPKCQSDRLTKKEYRYRGRDLWIIGSHHDIAELGAITHPVIPYRVNGLIKAFWSYFVSEKIKLRPLWRIDLAIQFGRLLL